MKRPLSGRGFNEREKQFRRQNDRAESGDANTAGQRRAKHSYAAYQRTRPDRLLDLAFQLRHFPAADRAGQDCDSGVAGGGTAGTRIAILAHPPLGSAGPGDSGRASQQTSQQPVGSDGAQHRLQFRGHRWIADGGFPPDTNGSVGNDQYVETVNTRYQVWSLNRGTNIATSVLGPVSINTLWAGFGGACQTQNSGDPVVLYDKVANRWLISQFTSAASGGVYYQCVAISTTANAAGTYARYAFAVPDSDNSGGGDFGDYPHYGVWTDAYYVMAHNFTTSASGGSFLGGLFGAMDRTKMLAGDPTATWQVIVDPLEGGHMPADLDGFTPPPGGAPGIFTSLHSDGMHLYRMKVDFTTPANTAKTLQAIMPIAPASAACGGGTCIPQPQSAFTIASLGDRLMFRLAYRNFIDHESLVVSHSVDPGVTGVVSGVRWYDFRISGQPDAVCASYPCTYQQGNHRRRA